MKTSTADTIPDAVLEFLAGAASYPTMYGRVIKARKVLEVGNCYY